MASALPPTQLPAGEEPGVFAVTRVPRTPLFVVSRDGVPVTAPTTYDKARLTVKKIYETQGRPPPRMARAPPIRIFGKKALSAVAASPAVGVLTELMSDGKKHKRASLANALIKRGYDPIEAHGAVAVAWRSARASAKAAVQSAPTTSSTIKVTPGQPKSAPKSEPVSMAVPTDSLIPKQAKSKKKSKAEKPPPAAEAELGADSDYAVGAHL